MFDQIKDLYKLRSQAAEMEKLLASEKMTGNSKDGIVVLTMNGKHDLLDVQITNDTSREGMQTNFKEAYADAQSKLQKVLMDKFKGMM